MSMKRGGGEQQQCGVGRTREGGRDRRKPVGWSGGQKKKKFSDENQKEKKKKLTALKITSISRKMTPFVGPVSSLLFKA